MRPLSIGEILDRAVTLFVRNAWLFLALAAILYVPVTVAQLSLGDFWTWYLKELTTVLSQPGDPSAALAMDQAMMQRAGPVGIITFVLWLVGGPLVATSMAHVTGNLLAGSPASFGESLRFALTRWGRVVVFWLLWIVALLALFLSTMLVLGFVSVALAMLARSPVLAVIFIVLLFIGVLFCMVLASVSAGVGFFAAILEDAGVLSAFASGIGRTINRQMFWRSVLTGLVLFAIAIGFSTIASVAGFGLLVSLKTGIPLIIINSVVAMVQYGFFVVYIALFYYDVRVRREGVDLESMVARLA